MEQCAAEETQAVSEEAGVRGVTAEGAASLSHDGKAGEDLARMRSEVERAEEIVDRLAERVRHLTSVLGRKLLWLAARAQEEVEDIWAEAQTIRRGEKP